MDQRNRSVHNHESIQSTNRRSARTEEQTVVSSSNRGKVVSPDEPLSSPQSSSSSSDHSNNKTLDTTTTEQPFACPPPKDVQHIDQVDWGSIQPKSTRHDPCGCLSNGNNLCCIDASCVLFACQEECRSNCSAGQHCGNKKITNKQWKKIQVFDAGPKGRGLRTLEPIQKGEFIIEYVGVAVKKKELEGLFAQYTHERMLYIMSLDGDIFIDARKKGGLARYINHSCSPNCIVDRWKVREV